MTGTPVFLTDLGLVNALGSGCEGVRERLLTGWAGGMQVAGDGVSDSPVGQVKGSLPDVPPSLARYRCRNNQLLLAAYAQVATRFESLLARYGPFRAGIVLGTSTSGIAEGEAAFAACRRSGRMPADFHYAAQEIGTAAPFLARHLGVMGPAYTVSTACTSSAKAIVSARNLLLSGACDVVLAGGVDSLCALTRKGFEALESVSPERCNPLSRNRKGINIGEAATLFVMTREPSAVALLGCGESSDAYHMSAPEPEGRGAEAAMAAALVDAGLDASAVGYVNLHGTATEKNDAMESRATFRVFGDGVAASSTKPLVGHTLGAAGATELAFCWLSLTDPQRRLPPHVWDGEADDDLPQLSLVEAGMQWQSRRVFMSNGYAFGGSNVSLVIGGG